MQKVDVTLRGLDFSFFNVYAPNIGTERTFFFDKLNTALSNVQQGRIIVLVGDFNCTLDHTLDRNHEEPHSPSANVLNKLIIYHDFVDVWREAFPNVKQYTWIKVNSNLVSAARLDRIYIQRSVREKSFLIAVLHRPFCQTITIYLLMSLQHRALLNVPIGVFLIGCCKITTLCTLLHCSGRC